VAEVAQDGGELGIRCSGLLAAIVAVGQVDSEVETGRTG
jgi:hypothetical protein